MESTAPEYTRWFSPGGSLPLQALISPSWLLLSAKRKMTISLDSSLPQRKMYGLESYYVYLFSACAHTCVCLESLYLSLCAYRGQKIVCRLSLSSVGPEGCSQITWRLGSKRLCPLSHYISPHIQLSIPQMPVRCHERRRQSKDIPSCLRKTWS